MTILLVHNYYQQPGGEDQVFEDEARLLEARGHRVLRFTRHNDAVRGMSRLAVARDAVWSPSTYAALLDLVRRERPAVVHFHNTLPLVSPSAYYAVRREGAAVVQTLHNYRLLCPSALFFRDGKPCEDCLGKKLQWPGVLHACYRDSRVQSAMVAAVNAVHRAVGTWTQQVDVYVALSRFARERFIAGGLPPERLVVKPHFVLPDRPAGDGAGGHVVFAGRLVPEKGILTLLDAWALLPDPPPLHVLGDGPLADEVAARAEALPTVTWLGRRSMDEVLRQMADAALVVAPSHCYETFGRTVIEAFSVGTPVVAARGGAMEELVTPGRDGWLVAPDDAAALAACLQEATASPARLRALRDAARATYERHYTADANYQMLRTLYARALATFAPAPDQRALTLT